MGFIKKGRILKIRLGYNANSSSMAEIVTVFIWGTMAAAALINMIYAIIFERSVKKNVNRKINI